MTASYNFARPIRWRAKAGLVSEPEKIIDERLHRTSFVHAEHAKSLEILRGPAIRKLPADEDGKAIPRDPLLLSFYVANLKCT